MTPREAANRIIALMRPTLEQLFRAWRPGRVRFAIREGRDAFDIGVTLSGDDVAAEDRHAVQKAKVQAVRAELIRLYGLAPDAATRDRVFGKGKVTAQLEGRPEVPYERVDVVRTRNPDGSIGSRQIVRR